MSEFDIIERYFKPRSQFRSDVIAGIGDDAALLQLPETCTLVVSTDTLVQGTHFREDTSAYDIGYKSLAVNLSDMAAMGAEPLWVTMSLTLPENNEPWISEFADGFFELAKFYDIALVGGDITRGPLAITMQIMGSVPLDSGIKRSGAIADDNIYVTGQLGMASFALSILNGQEQGLELPPRDCLKRLNRPEPRINIGLALREFASAAIDISDGLAADPGHLLEASSVGAVINLHTLPVADALRCQKQEKVRLFCLNGGDDYELCFTASNKRHETVEKIAQQFGCNISCIGTITAEKGCRWVSSSGERIEIDSKGYRHF